MLNEYESDIISTALEHCTRKKKL